MAAGRGHRRRFSTSCPPTPSTDPSAGRSCLAVKYGLIADEAIELDSDLDDPISSVEDAYLRLHLLSRRKVEPNRVRLDGLFEALRNIAWTSAGPVFPGCVEALRGLVAAEHHHLVVFSVDKFPRMLDYVVPGGVRIGDGDRVRLGAHLAEGTTVMHEGFVNFNAGTLGRCMVEGRVTPGVTVGDGSDIGAGASIMGTLSGGGKQRNSVGKARCSGPMQESATVVWWRPVSTSPRAPRFGFRMGPWSRLEN